MTAEPDTDGDGVLDRGDTEQRLDGCPPEPHRDDWITDCDAQAGRIPMVALKNVALRVPDLREAEDHYQRIFDAELVGREVRLDDGVWYALRPEQGWDELDVAGFKASWVGLRRDDLVIALFPGTPAPDTGLHHIGVVVTPEVMVEIARRLPATVAVEETPEAGQLTFRDRYGFRWQCSDRGFTHAGEIRADWLDL